MKECQMLQKTFEFEILRKNFQRKENKNPEESLG
jgi:hypothetical protein